MLRYQPSEEAEAGNATASVWVAMSRSGDSLDDMIFANSMVSVWETLEPRPGFAGWTDDYASILPLIEGWTK